MLLILDVDGVMTNGTKYYGISGEVLLKSFCDLDFTAIKKFIMHGWNVCWLSADAVINQEVAAKRDIKFYQSRNHDGVIDKVKWLYSLSKTYNTPICDIVYVGDDLFDIPIMREIIAGGGSAYCPKNAAPQVKLLNGIKQLETVGGHGAIMELYDSLFPMNFEVPSH